MENPEAYLVGALLGGLVIGILLGLIPWGVATKRGSKVFGTVAFVLTLLSGLLFGLLGAVPMAIFMTAVAWAITSD